MPVELLTDDAAAAYGRYAAAPSQADLERVFFLDDDDRALAGRHRGEHMRARFALQLVTVRWLGTFLEDPLDVPGNVLDFVAGQLDMADPSQVKRYTERAKTRRHSARYRHWPFRCIEPLIDERAGGLGEHPEPVPDHVGRVAGAGPGEQSPHRYRLGYVQVNGGVQYQVQPSADVGGRDGLRQGPGESVQDVSATGVRGGHDRGEQVEDDLVGNQVAAPLVDGGFAPGGSAGEGLSA
jgi:hypothetical protein